MSDFYMPTDMQYKDDLRKQRDSWNYIIEALEGASNFKTDEHIQKAYKMAIRERNRIIESLQD